MWHCHYSEVLKHVTSSLQPNKMVLTGRSVETQDCPPDANLHRGKVCCSLVVTALEPSSVRSIAVVG